MSTLYLFSIMRQEAVLNMITIICIDSNNFFESLTTNASNSSVVLEQFDLSGFAALNTSRVVMEQDVYRAGW